MAKTDDRASQYVFVEDEDIFEEDEKRLAARKQESGWMVASTASPSKVEARFEPKPATSRFHRDPVKIERDAAKLRRGLKQLKTVPPPPSTTNPQFTFSNILELWHKHNHLGVLKSKWTPGLSEEKLGYDVYLNTNDYVEKLEDHRQDLTKCFVYNETASHVTGVPPLRTEQDKQLQKRNGWMHSPATRTNNLSQRKAFFSQFSNPVRTFTVENNKKFSFLKSHSESKIISKAQVTKRALFQSPEKPNNVSQPSSNHNSTSSSLLPPSNYSVPSASSTASSSSSNSFITPSRSMLNRWIASRGEVNQQVSSSAGRARDPSIKRSCSKSLKFDGHAESDKKVRVVSIAKELSQHHHEKMLWAVQTLLKSEGVTSTDPEYKSLYVNMYQETTQVWLKHYENKPRSRNSTSGTCDLMVRVAKKILPSVEQKLGLSCTAINARKETVKKNLETSILPLNDNVATVSSKPNVKSSETDQSDKFKVVVEDVFSPEMVGVSNLCDDIDAVISSLDNLPPDPGDNNSTVLFANNLSSVSVCTLEKDSSHPVIKDLLSAPLLIDNKYVETIVPHSDGKTSSSPLNLVTNNSVETSSICYVQNVSEPSDIKVTDTDVIGSIYSNDKECRLVEQQLVGLDGVVTCLTTLSPVLPNSSDVKNDDSSSMTKVKDVSPANEACEKIVPTCVVKLYRHDYFVANSEIVKTPEQCYTSQLKFKNSSDPVDNINGYETVKKQESNGVCGFDIELSPGKSSSGSSDVRRSKRKRNSDASSSENTPNAQSKCRSNKRRCSKQGKDTDETLNAPRRSSRGRLSFDENSKIQNIDSENEDTDIDVPMKNYVNTDEVSSHDLQTKESIVSDSYDKSINENNQVCRKEIGSSEVCNLSEDTTVTADQLAESSSTADKSDGKSGRLDKENDSSMENISDVDTQNWSPILKLKRSSKNLWSSELKKKRISSRCKKENSENSPASSPFLDLEGPFKYRLCKRALPGEFVSAIIKGEIYVNKLKKLVKKRLITKDCVLVRTVQEGLELRIPVELFKKECVFLGPNKFQNMISDIVEDAVCKLEGFDSEISFNGFTNHDINRAVLASCSMDRIVKVIEKTGQVVKPLFTMYKYAIVKQSPQNVQDFFQIFVEILRTSLFLKKSSIDQDTIQVRPIKSESPKKIQLEINIPVNLIGVNHRLQDSILRDLTPDHNIISC